MNEREPSASATSTPVAAPFSIRTRRTVIPERNSAPSAAANAWIADTMRARPPIG